MDTDSCLVVGIVVAEVVSGGGIGITVVTLEGVDPEVLPGLSVWFLDSGGLTGSATDHLLGTRDAFQIVTLFSEPLALFAGYAISIGSYEPRIGTFFTGVRFTT